MEEGPRDTDAALHGHGAAQQQGAQAEEHHAHPEDAAEDAVRVELVPPLLGAVDVEHQAAVDEVAQQVRDHQAAGEQQEGGFGLDSDAFVGLEQDEEGEAVWEDADGHGDGRGCHRHLPLAAAAAACFHLGPTTCLWAPIGCHGRLWDIEMEVVNSG